MTNIVPPLNIPSYNFDNNDIEPQSYPMRHQNPFVFPPEAKLFTYREEQIAQTKRERLEYQKLSLLERQKLIKPTIPKFATHASIEASAQIRKSQHSHFSARELTQNLSSDVLNSTNSPNSPTPSTSRPKNPRRMTEFIQDKREIFLVSLVTNRREKEITRLQKVQDEEEEKFIQALKNVDDLSTQYKMQSIKIEQELSRARKDAESASSYRIDLNKKLKDGKADLTLLRSKIIKNEDLLETYKNYDQVLHQITPEGMSINEFLRHPNLLQNQLDSLESDNLFLVNQCNAIQEAMDKDNKKMDLQFQEIDDNFQKVLKIFSKSPCAVYFDLNRTKTVQQNADTDSLDESYTIHEPDLPFSKNSSRNLNKCLTLGIDMLKSGEFNDLDITKTKTVSNNDEMNELCNLIKNAYATCFNNVANVSPLTMLEIIESALEAMYLKVHEFDTNWVTQRQDEKNAYRREIERKLKQQQQEKEQQMKIELALKRAKMPIKKRNGRKLCPRTIPLKPSKKDQSQIEAEKLEEKRIHELLYGNYLQD